MNINIREAGMNDIARVAQVHIQSWRETYPGIMPQQKMDSLSLEACTRNWQNAINEGYWFYIAEVRGELCGFVSGGLNRSNEGCATGLADACSAELAAMYILAKYHGMGVGRALFNTFKERAASLGHESMVAWVAKQNPACGFYARMGGMQVDSRDLMVMGTPVPLLAYSYNILPDL